MSVDPTEETQWESNDPRASLPIPKEKLDAQRFRWTAPTPVGLSGTCAGWSVRDGAYVQLRNVLVDTSHRYQGTMLNKRVTHHDELNVVHAPVLIFPLKGAGDA